jgi:hypothetical protein
LTPENGLSYNFYLKNVSKDSTVIYPPSFLANGKLKTIDEGNINGGENFFLKKRDLTSGKYEWKVQSIDGSYLGSNFSEPQFFKLFKFTNDIINYILLDADDFFIIKWEVINPNESVNLDYSVNYEENWSPIAFEIPDIGYYSWKLPNLPYKPIRLKISDSQNANQFSISDFVIEINPLPFSISNVYPNPSNSGFNLDIDLVEDANITIDIINSIGQRVGLLYNNRRVEAGRFKVVWGTENIATMSSGIYFINIKINNDYYIKKFIYLK